jgi:DNA-binding MarR family transcriptional regulator
MDHVQPDDRDEIAELRGHYIGRLLLRANRAFSERATAKLQDRGHGGLGLAHTSLLVNLDLEGTRITTLAERVGISKQAIGQLVHDLEEKGYVSRSVDPGDRRAAIVAFTAGGWQFLRDAAAVKREIEAHYTAILGAEGMQSLRAALLRVLADEEA